MTKTRKNMDTVNWLTHRASSDLLRSCQCPFPSPVSYSGRHAAFRSRFLRPLCLSRDLSPPRSFSLTLLKYTYWSVIFLESPSICVCLVFYHAQLDGNYIFLAKKKKNPQVKMFLSVPPIMNYNDVPLLERTSTWIPWLKWCWQHLSNVVFWFFLFNQ